MKFVYLRRIIDGAVLDIPENMAEETLKHGGFERVEEFVVNNSTPPVAPSFQCPLCTRSFKTEQGLKVHKGTHNK